MEKLSQNFDGRSDIEKQRTISDAEFLKSGANYQIDEETGEKRLIASPEQIECIHAEIEKLLSKNIMTEESLDSKNIDITFDKEGKELIEYDFEIEEEQREKISPDNFKILKWENHVVDTYDQSGRCRVRVKNGEPRMSLKIPLLSKDTDESKCCIRLEFKPTKEEQKEDLFKIVELINQEEGTETHEKWGTPLKLVNGYKV